jgi:hypothetical protein
MRRRCLLVALASQTARLGLLAIAGHCAQWCAAAPRLSTRVRSAYIKAVCLVGSLDEGDGPEQADGEHTHRRARE